MRNKNSKQFRPKSRVVFGRPPFARGEKRIPVTVTNLLIWKKKSGMLRGGEVNLWQPFRRLSTQSGRGHGVAACPALGLLVTSDRDKNTLSVWGVPGGASGGGLRLVCTLGGHRAPMQFDFSSGPGYSGYLAFTPLTTKTRGSSSACPLLLVTDHGHDAVHLVDVVGRTHEGYLAAPRSIAGPRGVAASGASPLVAVSAWKEFSSGDHVVVVYRGGGAVWEAVRVIGGGFRGPGSRDGKLHRPYGLRFNRDGSAICVAEAENGRASVFRVCDGGFVRHIATGLRIPYDVEEVEGGWLVACISGRLVAGGESANTVEFVSDGVGGDIERPSLGKAGGGTGSGDAEFNGPVALATVPGLGLVVRELYNGGRLQVFATPDAMTMYTKMSSIRIAWMSTVARAVFNRRALLKGHWRRW